MVIFYELSKCLDDGNADVDWIMFIMIRDKLTMHSLNDVITNVYEISVEFR